MPPPKARQVADSEPDGDASRTDVVAGQIVLRAR
jgi:hypothetical protein